MLKNKPYLAYISANHCHLFDNSQFQPVTEKTLLMILRITGKDPLLIA